MCCLNREEYCPECKGKLRPIGLNAWICTECLIEWTKYLDTLGKRAGFE